MKISKAKQLLILDAVAQADEEELELMSAQMGQPRLIRKFHDEWYITVPCQCEHKHHTNHWVAVRRVRAGGDLRGKINFEDIDVPLW